jgi:hypothetical protein
MSHVDGSGTAKRADPPPTSAVAGLLIAVGAYLALSRRRPKAALADPRGVR